MMDGISLTEISKFDDRLAPFMAAHYSAPKGFVGRSICYAVIHQGITYGAIVAGSATRFLPGRSGFLGGELPLNNIVNNTFFHVERQDGRYPIRNFLPRLLAWWRRLVEWRWLEKYGDRVLAFETLVELPRTGECYQRDGWRYVGQTKGFTCKRVAGKGTDSWTGKRVWNTTDLRPKGVFMRWTNSLTGMEDML